MCSCVWVLRAREPFKMRSVSPVTGGTLDQPTAVLLDSDGGKEEEEEEEEFIRIQWIL